MKPNKKTVLLLGGTNAAYRPALWAQYFMERSKDFGLIVDTQGFGYRLPRIMRVSLRLSFTIFAYLVSDIVVIQPMSHTSPYSRLVYRLNRLFRKQILVDIYISNFETLIIDRKRFAPDSERSKQLKSRDRAAVLAGAPSVFLTSAEKSYYSEILGLDAFSLRTTILPLVTPERPMATRPFLSGKSSQPTIAWWGRQGNPLHGFENIAAACKLLLTEGFQGSFAFFASGGKDWAEYHAKFSHLADHPQVLFSKDYNFNNGKLTEFLVEKTDLALGTFGDTRKARTVLVNKVLDASAFGLPCLTQFSEGMAEFFEDGKTIRIADIDPEKIAEAIRSATSRPQELMKIGDNARRLVRSSFSPEKFHRDLDALLTQ